MKSLLGSDTSSKSNLLVSLYYLFYWSAGIAGALIVIWVCYYTTTMKSYGTIDDLYTEYELPEHLRMHMLWVSAVGKHICEHWDGPTVDTETLINVLLIHDIGNLVKIKPGKEYLGFDQGHTDEMFAMRQTLIDTYGDDDHAISNGIAQKLGMNDYAREILEQKIFMKNDCTAKSSDFTLKLAAYADQRVTFGGVVTLQERIEEGVERYKDRPGSSFNNPQTQEMIEHAYEIEKQIAQHYQGSLTKITNTTIAQNVDVLRSSPFPYTSHE